MIFPPNIPEKWTTVKLGELSFSEVELYKITRKIQEDL